jgi:hypothetical protein
MIENFNLKQNAQPVGHNTEINVSNVSIQLFSFQKLKKSANQITLQ